MADYALQPPINGTPITLRNGKLNVPDKPVIPFIMGDGTGSDIWKASVRVFDAAVQKAYNGKRQIQWMEVLAGESAFRSTGSWLPDATLTAFRQYLVGIKGPLTTPVGGGIRSLNVALRQELDLYACVRPVKYFKGVPSPVKKPEEVDMMIFRENTEDVYAGIEWKEGSPEIKKVMDFLINTMGVKKIRFPQSSSIGIKPISREGTERLVAAAVDYAIREKRRSVTIVHKGNIMKFTEGGFRDWAYELVKKKYDGKAIDGGPWCAVSAEGCNEPIIIKDVIADAFLQQILTRPAEYDVIATMNLNGDYISDALAAQVGGIGIAPGANINYITGHGIFEATHGTAPKYAGQNKVNPGSVILSGAMMLGYIGWKEAENLIIKGIEAAISSRRVTYDFHRLMEHAELVTCSGFGDEIISRLPNV